MKKTGVLSSILLMLIVSVICLFLSEGIARIILDPVDYLNPTLVNDPVLRLRIKSGSGGHDRWGFRNRRVPESADVAILGDSQTYGHSAIASQSWPSHFAEMSHLETYNLGIGGYGPADYLHLVREKVPELHPDFVFVGLYFGNDMKDAFRSVYRKEAWRSYRDDTIDGLAELHENRAGVVERNENPQLQSGLLLKIRSWLGKHSVLYRAAGVSVIGSLVHYLEQNEASHAFQLTAGPNEVTHLLTYGHLNSTDYSQVAVREGLNITLQMMSEINQVADSLDYRLCVVIIPTKHLVYERYLEAQVTDSTHHQLLAIVESEKEMRTRVFDYFTQHQIQWVDALPFMREAVEAGEEIYPVAGDHPNGDGYAVIAEAAYSFLDSSGTRNR